MRKQLELELTKEVLKLQNLRKQRLEIQEKIKSLGSQINEISNSLERTKDRILLLGTKSESRSEEHPDTPETLSKKNEANRNLYKEKLEFIKKMFPEEYSSLEGRMPSLLKDERIQSSEVNS